MSSVPQATALHWPRYGRVGQQARFACSTSARPLELRIEDSAVWLTGPAELVTKGEFLDEF
jgi:hypothetical protein